MSVLHSEADVSWGGLLQSSLLVHRRVYGRLPSFWVGGVLFAYWVSDSGRSADFSPQQAPPAQSGRQSGAFERCCGLKSALRDLRTSSLTRYERERARNIQQSEIRWNREALSLLVGVTVRTGAQNQSGQREAVVRTLDILRIAGRNRSYF